MLVFLKRLGIGFTYGIGFALGVAGILALTVIGGANYLTSTSGRPVYLPSSIPGEPRSKPDQFVITDTSTVKTRWGGISVLGTIDNTGDDTPRYVNVYADLFDKNGKFIYQCMHQFNEGLRKGQRANFMIQCHGMPAELATSYETHKVYARTF